MCSADSQCVSTSVLLVFFRLEAQNMVQVPGSSNALDRRIEDFGGAYVFI